MGLEHFDFVDLVPVQAAIEEAEPVKTGPALAGAPEAATEATLWRIGDVGIYATDSLVRRSPALQATDHAQDRVLRVHPATAEALGLTVDAPARVTQGDSALELEWRADDRIAPNTVWLPSSIPETSTLGPSMGPVSLEASA
jgi:NADH-quinone oxidoreductase subunit G